MLFCQINNLFYTITRTVKEDESGGGGDKDKVGGYMTDDGLKASAQGRTLE